MQQRRARLERSKASLQRYDFGGVKRIVFSEEKQFVIEEHLNAQNYRVYAAAFEAISERVRTVQRFQKSGTVMVWGQCPVRANFPWFLWNRGSKSMLRITGRQFLRAAWKLRPNGFSGMANRLSNTTRPQPTKPKVFKTGAALKFRFHLVIGIAPLQPRFESAGFFHMGHFGGKGQCCPTPQRGFAEETSTGRMAKVTDESNSYFDCIVASSIAGRSKQTRRPIRIKFAWTICCMFLLLMNK